MTSISTLHRNKKDFDDREFRTYTRELVRFPDETISLSSEYTVMKSGGYKNDLMVWM